MASLQINIYECIDCGHKKIVKGKARHTMDGRRCEKCEGNILPRYIVGVDLGSGKDKSV